MVRLKELQILFSKIFQLNFNSSMVRLKVNSNAIDIDVIEFQFLNGAIKRRSARS